jgi:hypothetical protein
MHNPHTTTALGNSSPTTPVEAVSGFHLNLLPFNLKYNGKAPISTYFQPQQAESSTYASFRGRRVYANTVEVPEGYTGYIVAGPAKPSASDVDVAPRSIRGEGKLLTPAPSFAAQVHENESGPRRSPRKSNPAAPILARPLPSKLTGKRAPVAAKRKFKLDSDSEDGSDEEKVAFERPTLPARRPRAAPVPTEIDVEVKDELPKAEAVEPVLQPEGQEETEADEEITLVTLERRLEPTHSFRSFQLWTPDAAWEGGAAASGTADEFVKGLGEWRLLDAEVSSIPTGSRELTRR